MNILTKYRVELFSFVLALFMSLSGVLIGNCPYPFWDKIEWLCIAENLVRDTFGRSMNNGDAYFVNVGFDKQLVDVPLTSTDSGRSVITDRKVLLDFLTIAERADYKYIMLDVRFEKGYNTEFDEALYSKIAKMRDVVCANHAIDFEIADSQLIPKSAYNDYYTTIFSSNFTRYQYLQGDCPSIALRMYQDLDGKTIMRKGLFYFNDGTLCENCPFLPIKGAVEVQSGDGSAADYYNLGPFLMTLPESQLIEDMKDKIVVIGDFKDDVHDTYMGMLPGPYLTFIAYQYLAQGGNKVSIVALVLMTILFYFIVWTKLEGGLWLPCVRKLLQQRWMGWLQWLLNWRVVKFMGRFVSYSVLLWLVCIVVYLVCRTTFNVVFPALVISIISAFKDSKEEDLI